MRYLLASVMDNKAIDANVRSMDFDSDGEAIDHTTTLLNTHYGTAKRMGLTGEIERFLNNDLPIVFLFKIPPSGIMPEMSADKWFQHLVCGWDYAEEEDLVYPQLRPGKLN